MNPADWDNAVITSDEEAALSEGFCNRCKSRLNRPVAGFDGSGRSETVVIAIQCSGCGTVYLR